MRAHELIVVASVAVLVAAGLPVPAAQASSHGHAAHDATVTSFDGTEIATTVFRPGNATATDPVPVVLHGHGWSGSRWSTDEVDGSAKPYLDAGIGVVSIDMRGHGASGGEANVQDPELEGRDVMAVIDHTANRPWVRLDGPGDPVLGAIGGSYGGGYQWITALEETRIDGETRFDALAPGITWHNLTQSLGPNGVVRSVWTDLLYAAAKATGTDVAPWIDEAFVESVAIGEVSDDVARRFYEHSPAWYADRGIRLDIPVLANQGAPDTLFNLNQGLANHRRALTTGARTDSAFVGHLDGHILSTDGTLPGPGGIGLQPGARGNPCAEQAFGSTTAMTVAWFEHHLLGRSVDVPSGVQLARDDGTCVQLASPRPATSHPVPGTTGPGTPVPVGAAGPRTVLPVTYAPTEVLGVPTLSGEIATTAPDARLFFGLAVGTSPRDAEVLHSQWMPLRVDGPTTGTAFAVDLAGVATGTEQGENLYLVVEPSVDQFAHHPSRVPGLAVLSDLVVTLPHG